MSGITIADSSTPPAAQSGTGTPPASTDNNTTPTGTGSGVDLNAGSITPPTNSTTDNSPWHSALKDQAAKDLATKKGWASIDDALKSYTELEQAFSGKADALAPKSIEDYKFTKPDGVQYDDGFGNWYKKAMFDLKVPAELATKIHDGFTAYAKDVMQNGGAEEARVKSERINGAQTRLTEAWGHPDNPAFKSNLEMAKRAMNQLKLGEELANMGAVVDGKIANSQMFMALAKIGQSMFTEDSLYGTQAASTNPFDPKTEDLVMQGRIFKEDPAKAKSLIMSLPEKDRERYQQLLSRIKA